MPEIEHYKVKGCTYSGDDLRRVIASVEACKVEACMYNASF